MVPSLHVVGECAAHTLELSQEDQVRHATILAQVREENNYIPKAGSLRSELALDDHLPPSGSDADFYPVDGMLHAPPTTEPTL
jgi:hypothetical protein